MQISNLKSDFGTRKLITVHSKQVCSNSFQQYQEEKCGFEHQLRNGGFASCRKKKMTFYRCDILFHDNTASGIASLKPNWEGNSVLKFRYGFKNRCNYFPFTRWVFTKQLSCVRHCSQTVNEMWTSGRNLFSQKNRYYAGALAKLLSQIN